MDSKRGLSALPCQAGQLSVWAWRLQGAVQATLIILTTVLCVESLTGAIRLACHPAPSEQDWPWKSGPEPLHLLLPGCLHMYVLGNSRSI